MSNYDNLSDFEKRAQAFQEGVYRSDNEGCSLYEPDGDFSGWLILGTFAMIAFVGIGNLCRWINGS